MGVYNRLQGIELVSLSFYKPGRYLHGSRFYLHGSRFIDC